MLAIKHPARFESLPRVSVADGPDNALARLLDWGAVIIENALERETVNAVTQGLAPWFDRTPACEGLFMGRKTRRFSGVFAKSRLCSDLAIHPTALDVVERCLKGADGKRCDAIQLSQTQAIAIDPGQSGQPIHRDDTVFPFVRDFELVVNAMWPLDAFTAENGGTRIVPRSQHWDRAIRPTEEDAINAEADPGSVIIWLGSVMHSGGANRSAAPRRGVVFSYSLGWLQPAEKLLLSIPPDVARTLPERLQRLIGYQVHRPSLGWVEERDPLEWLRGEVGEVAAAQDHFTPDLQQRLEAAFAAGGQHEK
jgi:ectoine hydroxylase-related dioxygenase (phytanoyl-CoA dioxygenase family)